MAVTPPTPERQAQIDAYMDYIIHRHDPAPKPVKKKAAWNAALDPASRKLPRKVQREMLRARAKDPAGASDFSMHPQEMPETPQGRVAESIAQTLISSLRKPFAHITSHGADIIQSVAETDFDGTGRALNGIFGYGLTESPLSPGGGLKHPNEPSTYNHPQYAEAYDRQQGAGTYYQQALDAVDADHSIPFLNNSVLKKGIGFAGDVLFDPATYFIPGSSVMQGAGRKVGTRFLEAATGAAAREMAAAEGAGLIARAGQVGMDLAGADLTQLSQATIQQSILANEVKRQALYATFEAQTRSRALQIATDIGTKGKGIVTDADVAYFFPGEQAGLAWRAPGTGPMGRKVGRLFGADIKELKFPVLSKNTTNPIVRGVGAGPRAFGRSQVGDAFGNFFGGQYAPMIRAGFHSGVPDQVYRALAVDMGASANRIGESVGMRMGHAAYPEMTKAFSQGAEVSTPPTFAQVASFLLRKEFKGLGTAGEDALVGVVESTDDALIDSTKGARPLADFFENAYDAAAAVGIKLGKASSYISRLLKKEVYDDLLREAQLRAEEAVPRDGTGGLETSLDGVARDPRVSIHHSRVTAAMIGLPEDATPAEVRAALTRYYAAKYPDGIFETSLRKIIANYVRQSDQAWGRQRMLDTLLGWGVAAKEEDVAIILEKMHQGNKGGAGRYFLDLLNKSKFPQYRQNKILREFIKLSDEAERINQQTAVANAQFPSGGAGPTTPNVPPASPAPTTQWGTAKTVEQYEQEVDDLINGAGSSNDPNTGGWDDDPYGPLGGTLTDSGQQRPRSGGGDKPRGIGRPIGDKPRIVTLGSDDMRLNMDGGDNGLPPVGGEGGGDPFGPGRPRKGRQTSPGGRAGKGPSRGGRGQRLDIEGGDFVMPTEVRRAIDTSNEQHARWFEAEIQKVKTYFEQNDIQVGSARVTPLKDGVDDMTEAYRSYASATDRRNWLETRGIEITDSVKEATVIVHPDDWTEVLQSKHPRLTLHSKWMHARNAADVNVLLGDAEWQALRVRDSEAAYKQLFERTGYRADSPKGIEYRHRWDQEQLNNALSKIDGLQEHLDAVQAMSKMKNLDFKSGDMYTPDHWTQRLLEDSTVEEAAPLFDAIANPKNRARYLWDRFEIDYRPNMGRTVLEDMNQESFAEFAHDLDWDQRAKAWADIQDAWQEWQIGSGEDPRHLFTDAIREPKTLFEKTLAKIKGKFKEETGAARFPQGRTKPVVTGPAEAAAAAEARAKEAATDPIVRAIRNRTRNGWARSSEDLLVSSERSRFVDTIRDRVTRELKTGKRDTLTPESIQEMWDEVNRLGRVLKGVRSNIEDAPIGNRRLLRRLREARKAVEEDIKWVKKGLHGSVEPEPPTGAVYNTAEQDALAQEKIDTKLFRGILDTETNPRMPGRATDEGIVPDPGKEPSDQTYDSLNPRTGQQGEPKVVSNRKAPAAKHINDMENELNSVAESARAEDDKAIEKIAEVIGFKPNEGPPDTAYIRSLKRQAKAAEKNEDWALAAELDDQVERVSQAHLREYGPKGLRNAQTTKILTLIKRIRELQRDALQTGSSFSSFTEKIVGTKRFTGKDGQTLYMPNKSYIPTPGKPFDTQGMQNQIKSLTRELQTALGGPTKMRELAAAYDFSSQGEWGRLTADVQQRQRLIDTARSELDRGNAAGGTFLGDTSLNETPYVRRARERQAGKLFGTRGRDPNSAAGMAEDRTYQFTDETLSGQRDEDRFGRTLDSNESGVTDDDTAEETIRNLIDDQTDPEDAADFENKASLDANDALDEADAQAQRAIDYDKDKTVGKGSPYKVPDEDNLTDMDNLFYLIEDVRFPYKGKGRWTPSQLKRKMNEGLTRRGGGANMKIVTSGPRGPAAFPPVTQSEMAELFDGYIPKDWTVRVPFGEGTTLKFRNPEHVIVAAIANSHREMMQAADNVALPEFWRIVVDGREYNYLNKGEASVVPQMSAFTRTPQEETAYKAAATAWRNRRMETVWIDENFMPVKGPDDINAVGKVRQVKVTAWARDLNLDNATQRVGKEGIQEYKLAPARKVGKGPKPEILVRTKEEEIVKAFMTSQMSDVQSGVPTPYQGSPRESMPFETATPGLTAGRIGPRKLDTSAVPSLRTLDDFKKLIDFKLEDLGDTYASIVAKEQKRLADRAADKTVASALDRGRSNWLTGGPVAGREDEIVKGVAKQLSGLQKKIADLEAVRSSSTLEETWAQVTKSMGEKDAGMTLPTVANPEGENLSFKATKALTEEQKIRVMEANEAVAKQKQVIDDIQKDMARFDPESKFGKEMLEDYDKKLAEARKRLADLNKHSVAMTESGGLALEDQPKLKASVERVYVHENAANDLIAKAGDDPLPTLKQDLEKAKTTLASSERKLEQRYADIRNGQTISDRVVRDHSTKVAKDKTAIDVLNEAIAKVEERAVRESKVTKVTDVRPRTPAGKTENIKMSYKMGKGQRNPNIVADTTIGAIEDGTRTSTSRVDAGSMLAIDRTRLGDVVNFVDEGKSVSQSVKARVEFWYNGTRIRTRNMDTGKEVTQLFDKFVPVWSKREGWTEAEGRKFFDKWLKERGTTDNWMLPGKNVEGRILIHGPVDTPAPSHIYKGPGDTGAVVGRQAHGWRTGTRVTKPVSEGNKAQILEISTKSTSPLGRDLSALNLKLDGVKVEDIYQAAKRGPNGELLGKGKNPDYFILDGVRHEGGDNQAVYDLIYRKALKQYVEANPGAVAELEKYAAYSDQFVKPDAHPNAASQAKSVSDFMAERVGKDVSSAKRAGMRMKHPETVLSEADLWPAHTASKDAYAVIPTNKMLRADGTAVMGAGLAKQAADKFPGLEARYGAFLAEAKANGTTTTMVDEVSRLVLVATKDDWRNPSSIEEVKTALDELSQLDEKLLIPALGTGKGGVPKGLVEAEMLRRGIKGSPIPSKGIDPETGAANIDYILDMTTLGLHRPVRKLAKAFGEFTQKRAPETVMLGPPTPEMAADEYNTILSTLDFGVSPRDPNMSDPFAGETELADRRLVSLEKAQKNHLRKETQAANKSMAYKAWIKKQLRDPNISAAEHQRLTDRLVEIDAYRAKARGKFARASKIRMDRIERIREVKTIMDDAKPAIEAARDNPISLKAIEIQKTGLLTENAWDRRFPTNNPRQVFQDMMGLTSQQLDQRFSALTEPMVKAAQDFHGGAALSKQSRKALYGAVDLQQSQRIITHPDIAEVFNSLEKIREPGALTTVLKHYDQFQLWWKGVALSSPGFHARNAMGGIFNNFLANSEPGAVQRFWKQHQKYVKGELSFEDAKKMQVLLRDVGGGQYSHVELGTGGASKFSLNPFSKDFAYLKGNAAVGNKIEFYLRGGLYWDRLEKGLGPNVAHADVVRFHFDYNDLSNFEEKVVKRVIPFYVWSRRNFPLQLEMMMRNPGKYRLYNQTRMSLMDGKDKDSLVHKYITNTMWGSPLPVHIGENQLFGVPDLPFTRTMSQNLPSFDNFKAKDPKTWLSTLDPYMQQVAGPLRVPIELLANRQFFNGRPRGFDDTSKTEGSDLGGLLKPLQQRVGKTRLDYIIGQAVPYAETIRKLVGSEKKFEDRRATSWMSYMGIPLRANSKADQQMEARRISQENQRRRTEATKNGARSTSWASIKNGSFGTTDDRPKSDKERTVAEAQAAGKLYRIESMKKRLLAEYPKVANILKMWGDGSGLVRMKDGTLKKMKLDFVHDGVKVIKVIDGDTIVVDNNGKSETVRLLGVDTGETKHKGVDKPATYWGPEATAYTRSSLKGRYVSLEDDEVKTDIYGRRLSHVSVDGRSFNNRLLKEGYARSLIIPPNNAHNKRMLRKELEAIKAKRGLWAKATFTDVVAP